MVETARFLGQFGAGRGNYTEERAAMFDGVSTEDLIAEAERFRSEQNG